MRSRGSLLVVASLAFCAAEPATAAEDKKVYPGTFCQPRTADAAFRRDSFGQYINTSAATQQVFCPIIQDSLGLQNDIELAEVRLFESSSADPPSCVRRGWLGLGGALTARILRVSSPRIRSEAVAHTLLALRQATITAWRPTRLPLEVVLFATEETRARLRHLADDLGWAQHCASVRAVPVAGEHASFLSHHGAHFATEVAAAATATGFRTSGTASPRATAPFGREPGRPVADTAGSAWSPA